MSYSYSIPLNKEKALKCGKAIGIGVFEYFFLKIMGRIDGTRGLPKKNEEGFWDSPRLSKERHSYDEYCSRMFGCIQVSEEKDYARMGELLNSVKQTDILLNMEKEKLKMESEKMQKEGVLNRKNGEQDLNETQVKNRRKREHEKQLAPIRRRIAQLETEIYQGIRELSEIRNRILENDNSVRMICCRVRDHIHQRVDIYWQEVLRKNPNRKDMPAAIALRLSCIAEEKYEGLHSTCIEQIDKLEELLKVCMKEGE